VDTSLIWTVLDFAIFLILVWAETRRPMKGGKMLNNPVAVKHLLQSPDAAVCRLTPTQLTLVASITRAKDEAIGSHQKVSTRLSGCNRVNSIFSGSPRRNAQIQLSQG
jgi:hypothetical protein